MRRLHYTALIQPKTSICTGGGNETPTPKPQYPGKPQSPSLQA